MAILCLGNSSLRIDGYGFIGELALDGSVRPVTGVLPMARCLRAAGVRHLAVAEENAAEAALVDSLAVIGVAGLEGRHSHAPWRTTLLLEAGSFLPVWGHDYAATCEQHPRSTASRAPTWGGVGTARLLLTRMNRRVSLSALLLTV